MALARVHERDGPLSSELLASETGELLSWCLILADLEED